MAFSIPSGHAPAELRHALATHRLEAGVDVPTIQRLLGLRALRDDARPAGEAAR